MCDKPRERVIRQAAYCLVAALGVALALVPALPLAQTSSGDPGDTAENTGQSDKLELIKTVHYGPVSAHFMGIEEPLVPRTYLVRELWFTFKGDPGRYRFNPEGTLYFSDWYFDEIYSPARSYILLLQDHYGPYHVIRTENLKAYLLGQVGPDRIVGKPGGPNQIASVHSDAKWLSDTAIQYTLTCCGEPERHIDYLAPPAHMGADDSIGAVSFRPGLERQLAQLPDFSQQGLGAALILFDRLNTAARRHPGRWIKGNVALGAPPRQFEPTDEELIAAHYGDALVEYLARQPADVISGLWTSTGHSPVLTFVRFDFREAKVAGSGLFRYALPPLHVTVDFDGTHAKRVTQ